MGSVLYLDRGMRRRGNNGGGAAAAKIQATHGTPSLLRPGYNCWAVARAGLAPAVLTATSSPGSRCTAGR